MKRERDNNGRFVEKDREQHTLEVTFPKFNTILVWIGIIIVLLPWISIIMRNEIIQKTFSSIDKLMAPSVINPTNIGKNTDDHDSEKQNGYFQ